MANDLEERLSKLEHAKTRVTAIFGVLGVLGLGLASFALHLSQTVSGVSEGIDSAEERIQGVEDQIPDIPNLVDVAVKEKFTTDLLSTWAHDSVLGQLQAQAICTAMSPRSKTVMAILRTPTGLNSDGKRVSELCGSICPRYIAPGTEQKAQDVGAVHVYSQSKPFGTGNEETFRLGLATHIYPVGYSNPGFGPNYCCCGG